MIDGPSPRVAAPTAGSVDPDRGVLLMTARSAGAGHGEADCADPGPHNDDQAASRGHGPAWDDRLPEVSLGSRRAGQLAPEPKDRIVIPVDDALLQGNDGIVGDRDRLRADFGAAFGDVAEADPECVAEEIAITDNAIIPLKERLVDRYYDPVLWLWRKLSRKT